MITLIKLYKDVLTSQQCLSSIARGAVKKQKKKTPPSCDKTESKEVTEQNH